MIQVKPFEKLPSEENPVEILLVEDSPSDAKLTLRSLLKSGVVNRIDHVKDGQAALDYLFCVGRYADRNPALSPRMVLLDIKLPKVDGLQVLERIRSDPRTTNLPVVILTSSKQERDIARGYALRANSYIVKPVDFAQFAEAVKSLGMYWLLLNTPASARAQSVPAPESPPDHKMG
jgi:CheY-like chemotaxis protein